MRMSHVGGNADVYNRKSGERVFFFGCTFDDTMCRVSEETSIVEKSRQSAIELLLFSEHRFPYKSSVDDHKHIIYVCIYNHVCLSDHDRYVAQSPGPCPPC